ncbi:MAG: ribonuclease HI family protein [Candidatus Hydrogenedentes bacterium]|nr:ribonuclease HI family protein [Candidatus Hydrogenedentota bacterium]
MRVIANIDGGSRGNPGPAAAGVVIRTQDDGTVLHMAGVYVGRATNNVAEYNGLLEALKRAAVLGADEVEVLSDSELLVKQMNGEYRVRNATLKPLFEEANRLWNKFAKVIVRYIPREQNQEADKLANKAMNLKRDVEE